MGRAYWHGWVKLAKIDDDARKIVDRYDQQPEWELNRMTSDTWEQRNVIDDPEHTDRLVELKDRLADWMESENDTG